MALSVMERLTPYKIRKGVKDEESSPANSYSMRSNLWVIRQRFGQAVSQTLANLEIIATKQAENEILEQEIKLLKWKLVEAKRREELERQTWRDRVTPEDSIRQIMERVLA